MPDDASIESQVSEMLNQGASADPASAGGAAPVSAAPAPAPAPAAAPVTPADPEFELEPGQKFKASEIKAWKEAHGQAETLKPVKELDDFLRHPENRRYAQAFDRILRSPDDKLQAVLDLLEGKEPAKPAQPVAPGQAPSLAAIKTQFAEDTDPRLKALIDYLEAKEGKLSELEKFKTDREAADQESQRKAQAAEAQARVQKAMDEAWSSQKFQDLVNRYPEADRKEIEADLRSRLLFGLHASAGKIPPAEIAKTLHGRTSLLIDGLIKAYAANKAKAPPAGGASGTAGTAPAKVAETREEVERQVKEALAGKMEQ